MAINRLLSMIEISKATEIILNKLLELPQVQVPLLKSKGRILRQEVCADTDFPPFDKVMMDGIAINYEDYASGIRHFNIHGVQPAGSPPLEIAGKGDCVEVMTGGVRPLNADTIVPYEDISIDQKKQIAIVGEKGVVKGKNIHDQGKDKKKGDILLTPGSRIGTPEIAISASVGLIELMVTKNPKVVVISNGSELVDIGALPLPHQIRRSNVYALVAELRNFGIKAELIHLPDVREDMKRSLEDILNRNDVLLMSGGVSKGKFDYVPGVLEESGVEMQFHGVMMKPGKPFWYGTRPDNKFVFAFPGNPVSTFLCFHKFFIPWIQKSLGLKILPVINGVLKEDVRIRSKYPYFLQVKLQVTNGGVLEAMPFPGQGSGDHANLVSCDAFMELPGDRGEYKKGEAFPLIKFREFL